MCCFVVFWSNVLSISSSSTGTIGKMQFRGPELFNEKRTLIRKNLTCLESKVSSLNLHIIPHVHFAFWFRIFFRKHGKSVLKIGNTTVFWLLKSRSWRHNAGARELFEQSGRSIEVGGWLNQWHVAMQWHQCRWLDHDINDIVGINYINFRAYRFIAWK